MEKEHIRNCWYLKVFLSVCLQQEMKKCTMGEDVLINSGSKLSAINQILCLQKENIKAVKKICPIANLLVECRRRNLKVALKYLPDRENWFWNVRFNGRGKRGEIWHAERKLMRLLTWVGTDCCNLALFYWGLECKNTRAQSVGSRTML